MAERSMTKKEIVRTISEEIGLTQLKTKKIVQKTFDAIIDALASEGRIELRNFGVFEVKKRAARKARNPRTGDQVEVPEKFVVTFKPGKEMEARVGSLLQQKSATSGHEADPPTVDAAGAPQNEPQHNLGSAGIPHNQNHSPMPTPQNPIATNRPVVDS